MNKTLFWFTSLAALISILISIGLIVALFWYAVYGNPAADIGHFVKEVRQAAK